MSDSTQQVTVGICGLGTVGGGTYRLLNSNADESIDAARSRIAELVHLDKEVA